MPDATFMETLIERAKSAPCRICLPEADSPDILRLAERILCESLGTPVLVGRSDAIELAAQEAGASITGAEIFDPSLQGDEFVHTYLARYDNFSEKALRRRLTNAITCAMLLLKAGSVDCVAAGKECSTGDVVAAAMQIVGLAEGVRSPSSLGIAEIPGFDGPEGDKLGLADCAITAQPDASELAGIAISSADTARALLGWEPRVALLSFSTTGSANHPSIDVVKQAVELVREARPDIACDGELQFDAAIIPEVAAHKLSRESAVAGRANILVFPNLHAGNIGVKMVQIFGHANAYGPVLQGFAKPVCDFSRSAPIDEMLGNVAMLVIRAASGREV